MTPILFDESFLEPFGKALALLFLPYLAAFLLQSNYLLREYIALLQTSSPDPTSPPEKPVSNNTPPPPTSKWPIASIVSTFLLILILSISLLQARDTTVRYSVYVGSFVSVAAMTAHFLIRGKFIVHRTSDGRYITSKHEGSSLTQNGALFALLVGGIAVFAFCMVASLSGPYNSFSIAFVTTAFVFTAAWMGVAPLRPLVVLYSCIMSLILAYLLFFNHFAPSIFQVEDDSVWMTNILSKSPMRYSTPFLPAAFGSWFSAPLIACMLRFDFNRALLKNPGSEISCEVVTYPPSSLGKGIVIPKSLPFAFPKPYYALALTIWGLIRITTIVLCLTTGFPLKSVYDSSCLGIFLELPIMTIVLLLFATIRGEARALWNYTEVWFVKPSKGELLPVSGGKMVPQQEHVTT